MRKSARPVTFFGRMGRPLGLRAVAVGCAAMLALAAGCSTATVEENTDSDTQAGVTVEQRDNQGCVSIFDDNTDYFPHKVELKYATNYTVEYSKAYAVVTVAEPFQGAAGAAKYVLYPCGAPTPELSGDLSGATAISTPITSMFSGSTTHLPLLEDLGHIDLVAGVGNASYVSNAALRQRIDAGEVVEYSPAQTIDTEQVIAAQPSLLMTGGMDAPEYEALQQAGIPVVANAEWLEEHPLGRAEWLKFMGLLTSSEQKADEVFNEIDATYQEVKAKAAELEEVPMVLPGQMSQGDWYMPGGKSYVAQLLKDANATYAWADTDQTGSMQLTLEDVLGTAKDADVWLSGANVQTKAELVADDPRYAEFAAFSEGAVWSNNKSLGPTGGNLYWERGVTHPEIVLSDLVVILHPDAMPGYETEFYRQLD